ncbi:MAG: DUF2117 domain-containing protein [Methanosphaera stadtmanae]|jgi:hypothetical protein|nr:DUF2117 domain-containing protein [Methanosphaera stadtmanae]
MDDDYNIAIVVHGPGIVDTGYAKKIINLLSDYGDTTAILGGTMGRTAVIDASLEDTINIEKKLLPSQSISYMTKNNDIVFLLNYGKSTITGHTFGYKVFNKTDNAPLVQIERPGEDDGCMIIWNSDIDIQLVETISNILNLPIVSKTKATNMVESLTGYSHEDDIIKRKVAGVSAGENIMMNGIIIGKATDDQLIIYSKDNQIIRMEGGKIKQHGLEKLGKVDLSTAIIKTGLLRKSDNIKPRIIKKEKTQRITAVYLDHAADDIYQYKDENIIVSVGDDTTLLSSDILYRFNTPIIGITDGDLDKIVEEGFKLENSIIIQVESGYDDIMGRLIFDKIFHNNIIIEVESFDKLKENILKLLDDNISYNIIDKQLKD